MATSIEPHALVAHWIATAKTREMVEQYVAALEYNVRDCGVLLAACGAMPVTWHIEHGLLVKSELLARRKEANEHLKAAQKRLEEMGGK